MINLAGRSVNCRYTAANRRDILDSRVLSTRVVAQAIATAARPPRVWLQASTATIYAHRYDAPNDEASGLVGGVEPGAPSSWKFSIDVARAWEAAFAEAAAPRTRKVALRSAITLSPDPGGIFDTLLGRLSRQTIDRFTEASFGLPLSNDPFGLTEAPDDHCCICLDRHMPHVAYSTA